MLAQCPAEAPQSAFELKGEQDHSFAIKKTLIKERVEH